MRRLALRTTPLVAVLGSFALSSFFVGALYLWKLAGYKDENRNDVGTIQRRFLSTLLSCACSAGLVFGLARPAEDGDLALTPSQLLGFGLDRQRKRERRAPRWPWRWRVAALGCGAARLHRFMRCILAPCNACCRRRGHSSDSVLSACFYCVLLTVSLFVGPLVQHVADVYRNGVPLVTKPEYPWRTLRDIVMAPLVEEIVFRACLVRLWDSALISKGIIIFCSPLCFALAHTHHFVEHVRRYEDKSVALMQVAFQVFYTSLFGMYTTFLLLRTGSTVAVVLTHGFCNHQGFPDILFLVQKRHPLHGDRLLLGVVYLLGVAAFVVLIMPLTAGFTPIYECMRREAVAGDSD
eukprot:TRINITY_DN11522_c0_g1_i1.p1 TRINITY_DN11522_c0_g1~~TRINITY_DN11522_c0_g1_i1.p1  ORF type:complete len:351 (+),score=60.92 TRINITY_DN11522_c0_g1_i1:91-1143(+)